ncbi:MAG: beta-lactamase family protein [Clostridia bacterium]|nr:beta-lactamase family protein [Clostridia bacterium]
MYTFSSLEKYLDTVLVREKVPGFDCMVIHDGKQVFRHTAGFSDLENKIPMNGKEHFYIYSASKPIACVAALHAMEEGKYLLNQPLWWYLGEYANCKVKTYHDDGTMTLEPVKSHIRICDLFSMTAGLNYDTNSQSIRDAVAKNPKAPTREIVRAIANEPLDFEPGSKWQYSLCHDVLAGFVEVVTGERFADYVKRVIFEPLGMNDTYYHPPKEVYDNISAQYRFNYTKGIPERVEKKNGYVFGEEYDAGGAGVVTTLEDYAKFATALANFGVGANGARILSKASVNLLRTNTLNPAILEEFTDGWENNIGYGYGFGVRTKIGVGRGGDLCSVGEFGWDGAAGFLVSVNPDKKMAVIYAQHMLDPHNHIIHPKIKNIVNQIIE